MPHDLLTCLITCLRTSCLRTFFSRTFSRTYVPYVLTQACRLERVAEVSVGMSWADNVGVTYYCCAG